MITFSVFVALSMLSLSEAQSWPDGTYCLPKPRNSPCPSGWKTGHRHHDTEDRDGSMYCNVKRHGWVPYNTAWCRNLGWGFCCKTRANYPPTGKTWPRGAYCIFKKGVSCPRGFSSGYLHWDDEDSRNANSLSGTLPEGVYNRNTKIYFCCRNDPLGTGWLSVNKKINRLDGLPKCSEVMVMRYKGTCPSRGSGYQGPHTGYLQWDTEDSNNQDQRIGVFPDGQKTFGSGIKIEFCSYTAPGYNC